MALVFANVGENLAMTWAFKSTSTPENLTLKLYTNNYTPVAGSTAGSFTECAVSGYSAKTLSRASWGDPSTNGSGKAEMAYAAQTFSFTGSGTIYGYMIVSATSGTLVLAELFSSARSVASGDSLTITPKITGNSEN